MLNLKSLFTGVFVVAILMPMLGCDVESEHPLSDEHSSTPDMRLLGKWQTKEDDEWVPWQVGRHPKSDKYLMAFVEDNNLADTLSLLFTTTIGDVKYFSWGGPCNDGYLICRYEMPDEDTLRIRFMKKDAIQKAIADGRLSGEVKIETKSKKPLLSKRTWSKEETARILAEPQELRVFLEKNGDLCYDMSDKAVKVFKRIMPNEKK